MKSFAFALMAVAVYAQREEDPVPDFDALIENGEDGMLISPMNPNADGSMDMEADVVKMEKVFGILTDLVDLFCYDIFNEEGMNDDAESFVTTAEVEGIETATNTLMDTMRSVDMDFDESTMPMMRFDHSRMSSSQVLRVDNAHDEGHPLRHELNAKLRGRRRP